MSEDYSKAFFEFLGIDPSALKKHEPDIQYLADELYHMYSCLMKSGFSSVQAFDIMMLMLEHSLTDIEEEGGE